MSAKTLPMPEDAVVNLLRSLPKNALLGVFWKTVIENDTSPLTDEEKTDRKKAYADLKKGETIKWKDLR